MSYANSQYVLNIDTQIPYQKLFSITLFLWEEVIQPLYTDICLFSWKNSERFHISKWHGVKGERISNVKSPNRVVEIDKHFQTNNFEEHIVSNKRCSLSSLPSLNSQIITFSTNLLSTFQQGNCLLLQRVFRQVSLALC